MSFQTATFAQVFRHAVEYAAIGGTTYGECQSAARQIRDGDHESWHLAWVHLAEQVRRHARQQLAQGETAQVRDTFLRAALYYQFAGYFLERSASDARSATTAQASAACFATAMRLSEPACELRDIVCDGTWRGAYWHTADLSPRPRPTLLIVGASASALSVYFSCVVPALQAGWNCLMVCEAAIGSVADAARSLLEATAHVPADLDCVALLVFREEAAEPEEGICRFFTPIGRGTQHEVRAALPGLEIAVSGEKYQAPSFASSDLGAFHQQLCRWLD